jgi:KH domain-containing protein
MCAKSYKVKNGYFFMRNVSVQSMRKIKKAVPAIENKVKVKIGFGKGVLILKGSELNEYLVEQIVRAIDFGFCVDDALLLANEDFVLEFIDVKEHTRRKNLRDVRSRIIGTEGKARKTIEKLTGAEIVINANTIGVIVDSEHLDAVIQGIESLINGAKHGNVFAGLERQNVSKRRFGDDLGLKDDVEFDGEEGLSDDEISED